MIITHHREKLINAIVYFARNTKNLGKTKLMKLLYFLDFIHFKQTGKSVTGLDYFAWNFGPVPVALWKELTEGLKPDLGEAVSVARKGDFQHIQAKKQFQDDFFSSRESKILEQVAFIFKDASAEEMVEVTHLENTPWSRTLREKGEKAQIDYLLAIDSKLDSLPREEAQERASTINSMHQAFGVD